MSRMKRLTIRGIRNFEEQTEIQIDFSSPLTLIFSPHAAGKTTIIEALRYAICGKFPPNSDGGKYFVDIPRTVNSKVTGVIEAVIIDKDGYECTVRRGISTCRTNTGLTVENIENKFIRKLMGFDAVIPIAEESVDINAIATMHVSKLILEHVIFCQPDDFDWPLDDNKLKEILDECFAISGYNKAFELRAKAIELINEKKKYVRTFEETRNAIYAQLCIQDIISEDYTATQMNLDMVDSELMIANSLVRELETKFKDLDNAIIEYHETCMKYINDTIKEVGEIWKILYIGRTGLFIKIHVDATEDVDINRRSYNYKLVQVRDGNETDIKGLCTCIEKVLISIILRITLAEIFYKDCGTLVLDIPTTKDQRSADILSSVLYRVVKLRSRYKNFQLVILTLDTKIPLKLALLCKTGYYQLQREPDGYSSITYNSPEPSNASSASQDRSDVNFEELRTSFEKELATFTVIFSDPDVRMILGLSGNNLP